MKNAANANVGSRQTNKSSHSDVIPPPIETINTDYKLQGGWTISSWTVRTTARTNRRDLGVTRLPTTPALGLWRSPKWVCNKMKFFSTFFTTLWSYVMIDPFSFSVKYFPIDFAVELFMPLIKFTRDSFKILALWKINKWG